MSSLKPVQERLMALAPALDDNSRRLFHGRGGCYEGLNHVAIDWFSPALVITLFEDLGASWEESLVSLVKQEIPIAEAVYLQRRYKAKPSFECVGGQPLVELFARRQGLKFKLHLSQQNIGFFLDIEPARQWLQTRCKAKRVLNLFAYTCSFSVLASHYGASSVLNMDLSSKSLALGRESYRANAIPTDNVRFYANDILKSWGKLKRHGPYDLVIIDPPSFQKGSFVATKDYQKVLRRMASLTTERADVLLGLNAPEISYSTFLDLARNALDGFEFVERLTPSIDFPDADIEKALKLLVFRKSEAK